MMSMLEGQPQQERPMPAGTTLIRSVLMRILLWRGCLHIVAGCSGPEAYPEPGGPPSILAKKLRHVSLMLPPPPPPPGPPHPFCCDEASVKRHIIAACSGAVAHLEPGAQSISAWKLRHASLMLLSPFVSFPSFWRRGCLHSAAECSGPDAHVELSVELNLVIEAVS